MKYNIHENNRKGMCRYGVWSNIFKRKTVFSVFSPIAEEISLMLYDNGIEGDAIKKLPGIGMFSDDIRDVVKGHVFYMDELGFVNGGKGKEEIRH